MADKFWQCESCGEVFSEETFSHPRYEDDGRGNAIPVECGPIHERTTDNAAAAPAAPTSCPWTQKARLTIEERRRFAAGKGVLYELVSAEFARRLEALVHQQQAWARTVNRNVPLPDALAAEFDAIDAAYAAKGEG